MGSACTLVAGQILRRKPELVDDQLATLLLGAILLDTVNFDPAAGRATAEDMDVALRLRRTVDADTDGLYQRLIEARADVKGLSSEQLLRKDYKEAEVGPVRMGLSSVPLLLDSWGQRDPQVQEALSRFLHERDLDILAVFLYEQRKSFRRQLLLCSWNAQLIVRAASGLLDQSLGLQEKSVGDERGGGDHSWPGPGGRRLKILCFEQGDSSASRKKIAPLLGKILQADER
jgi:exopolyphosphatase